jgi:hypothetical protein
MWTVCFPVISNTNAVTLQPHLQIVQDVSLYEACPESKDTNVLNMYNIFNLHK